MTAFRSPAVGAVYDRDPLVGRCPDDRLVKVSPLLKLAGDWRKLLAPGLRPDEAEVLRQHERTGRPLADDRFVARLEKTLRRTLRRRKPGPKPHAAKR